MSWGHWCVESSRGDQKRSREPRQAARAALLACVGGLALLMRARLRWFPALVTDLLCMPNHHNMPHNQPAAHFAVNATQQQRQVVE